MKKVLMTTNELSINGISTVIKNYYQNLNKDEFSINICANGYVDDYYKDIFNDDLIETIDKKKHPIKYFFALKKLIKKNKYDIVHVHGNSVTMALELLAAKMGGAKIRIAHSHNSINKKSFARKLASFFFNRLYTHACACSNLAGAWLFKKEFTVIENGFDVNSFKFSSEKRKQIREKLNIQDSFVIGHVGRFNDQKNHRFIIDIFEKIYQEQPNSKLLLVGNGPLFNEINELIDSSPAKDNIIVYGESTNTLEVYSAMDNFILPSKYEGLGIVVIEAQITGLPCIVSTNVPEDVTVTKDIKFISLENKDAWVKELTTQNINPTRETTLDNYYHLIKRFDIKNNVKILENIYLQK